MQMINIIDITSASSLTSVSAKMDTFILATVIRTLLCSLFVAVLVVIYFMQLGTLKTCYVM